MSHLSFMANEFLTAVRARGWQEVPFPIDRVKLVAAADAFLDFCTLAEDEKQSLVRYLYPNNDVSRVGYFKRAQAAGNYDDKQLWHHHLKAEELLGAEPAWQHEKTRAFVTKADEILTVGIQVLTNIFEQFESEYPGLGEKFLRGGEAPKIYLRFVKYIPQKPGEFLAKGHFDRGGLALAICESAPGLRLGRDIASLQPFDHREHRAVFFPGFAFPEHTDSSFFPVWHDVVQKSEAQYRPDCARWAIVLFADTHDSVPPTVEQARSLLM